MRRRIALIVLLLVYVVWGIAFATKAPYRKPGILVYQANTRIPDIGAPDELQHANYLDHVMSGKGFPVLQPGSPDLELNYQSHQPPLYYILAAGWAKAVGAEPTEETGLRVRYFNVLIGLGTLLGVYFSVLWGLKNENVALAAVAVTGLMPMFVALNSAITNDSLLYCVGAWTMALCARAIHAGWPIKSAVGCGLVLGVGLLTKTLALAYVAAVFFALVSSWVVARSRPPLVSWAVALALPFVIGSPWMLRNQNLYGDPFAIQAFQEAFVRSPRPQDVALPAMAFTDDAYAQAFDKAIAENPDLEARKYVDIVYEELGMSPTASYRYWTSWVGWWVGRSYVGVLGYMDIFILERRGAMGTSNVFYIGWIAILFALILGWAYSLKNVTEPTVRAVHAANVALGVVVFAMFVKFNMVYFQGQARYLYPAVSATSAALGTGVSFWLKNRSDLAWIALAIPLVITDFLAYQAMAVGFPARLV